MAHLQLHGVIRLSCRERAFIAAYRISVKRSKPYNFLSEATNEVSINSYGQKSSYL